MATNQAGIPPRRPPVGVNGPTPARPAPGTPTTNNTNSNVQRVASPGPQNPNLSNLQSNNTRTTRTNTNGNPQPNVLGTSPSNAPPNPPPRSSRPVGSPATESKRDHSEIPTPPPNPPQVKVDEGNSKNNNRRAVVGGTVSKRKGEKMNIADKAPLPMEFLRDPNGKIQINEANFDPSGKEKWFTLTFEYAAVLKSSDWSKPDKEGELVKPGSRIKANWKTRYAIVQGSKFFCFKTKPQNKDDEPTISIELHGGALVEAGTQGKYHCFELVEADNVKRVSLAAKNKNEYESWLDRIQAATTYEGPVVEIVEQMKQSIAVQYSPEFGYAGLPVEWKQLFKDHAIQEKDFFEKTEEILKTLRFNKTSEKIVSHPVTNTPVAIEDVVNKKGSPDMYTGFQLLGSGSFGEVYEAIHISTNQRVAIKKMLVTPRRLKLFISEINIQRSTQHPNVVKLIDAFPVDTHIWVVLEYMPNGNLTMVLDALKEAKVSMTEPQIAYVCLETLKSLSYVHSLHRIHRDIKSDNVLIGGNGEIKLADFGYAVQLSGEDEKRQTVCGSPYWMAPEVIMGQQYGKEVDIWSLGIMLMECCDLEPPYILESPSKALVLLSTKPVPPLKNPEKWSPELRNFRDLCLNRDPKARPEAIELLQHPFLRRTCSGKELKDQLLDRQKKKKDACSIQ